MSRSHVPISRGLPRLFAAALSGRHRGLRFTAAGLSALALLIWAKLLLVTGHPRTAIADPPEPARAASQHVNAPATPGDDHTP